MEQNRWEGLAKALVGVGAGPDNPLLRRAWLFGRRMINEGFGAFFLSLGSLTVAAILLRAYIVEQQALDSAMRQEMDSAVGTRQEPADTDTQFGLTSAALAEINARIRPETWGCREQDKDCRAIEESLDLFAFLTDEVLTQVGDTRDESAPVESRTRDVEKRLENMTASWAADFGPRTEGHSWLRDWSANTASHVILAAQQLSSGSQIAIGHRRIDGVSVRPELRAGPGCITKEPVNPWTQVLVPAQLGDDTLVNTRADPAEAFPERVRQAIVLSGVMDDVLAVVYSHHGSTPFASFVQAYFISPDSVLRIWTNREIDVCREFPPTRLWAAKNYFTRFWTDTVSRRHATAAYIDFGGNGLVQTICRPIEGLRSQVDGARRLVGVFCADYKLDDQSMFGLGRHLSFETAIVHISATAPLEPNSIIVELSSQEAAQPQTVIDLAIAMQKRSLTKETVQRAIHSQIVEQQSDLTPFRRDITPIRVGDDRAYFMPLGAEAADVVKGMVFFSRKPGLPWSDLAFAIIGFALLGVSLASGLYGWSLAKRADELRERVGLLRNLQVGVVQVDKDDWILDCNDRAEELIERRLPKSGSRFSKIQFKNLLDLRVVQVAAASDGPNRPGNKYRQITINDIANMRGRGQASSYYARLSNRTPAKWLRISATPMMLAGHQHYGSGTATLAHIFASVEEVPDEVADKLTLNFQAVTEPESV